jgi:hypothetical protein
MTLLNITILLSSLAMLAILTMVFFAVRLKSLLKAHLYHRAFSFLAVVAVAGILLAGLLSFNLRGQHIAPAMATFVTINK